LHVTRFDKLTGRWIHRFVASLSELSDRSMLLSKMLSARCGYFIAPISPTAAGQTMQAG
jgi:hypothetical protein